MTEVPSQLSPDIKTNEEIMRGLAEEELGSLVQKEVDLDAQIEAKKTSIEQKRVSGETIDVDTEILEALEEKRGRITAALELSARKHGYELSAEMGDNTHNVLIDGVLIKQKKEQGVSMVSTIERDTISHMTPEKPPTTTEKLRELSQTTKEESRGVTEANLFAFRQQLKDLQENMDKGSFSPDKDGGVEGDRISAEFLKKQIEALEIKLGEKTPVVEENSGVSPEWTSVGDIHSIVYESPSGRMASENMPPVSYRDIDGATIPMREVPEIKQETSVPPQETPVVNEEFGRSFLSDETIMRINKEIDEIRKKTKEATTQLRDHTTDASEPQKILRQADKQIRELNKERTEHIRNKIKSASIEEVRAIQDAARKVMTNQAEIYKTEAIDALQAADNRIKELGAIGKTGKAPETTAQRAETTQEIGSEKQSPQEKLARVETERAELVKKQRDNAITETEQIAPESSQTVPEMGVPSSSQPETAIPNNQEGLAAPKEEVLNPFEKSIARIRSEDPKRAERLLATIGASPEQKERIEKFLGATQAFTEKTGAMEKEKDPWVVERALKIGEWYRRLPLKYKLAASAVLVGTASATAAFGGAGIGMIAGAAFVGSTGQRFLGSLAMFATVEGILTKRLDERNLNTHLRRDSSGKLMGDYEKEEKIMGVRMNVILGALAGTGVFLGGKLLGDYLSGGGERATEIIPPPSPQAPVVPAPETLDLNAKEIFDSVQEKIKAAIPLPHEAPGEMVNSIMTPENELVGHAAATETVSSIMTPENEIIGHAADKMIETSYAVQGGDNLWNIIKEKIPEIQGLDGEGRQSNAIANIIEQIKKDPESFGITSGNVDTLSAGDTIDLEKVRGVLDNTKISVGGHEASIIERASGLTDIEASHIMENNAKISAWHTAHPDALLTTETVDKILSGTIESAAETNTLSEITKDYILSMPDAGGRTIEQLTAEALSMDTDTVLHADVQTMFGSKGFFGYGFLGTNGERSIDWLDFKGRAVSEVLAKKFDAVAPFADEEGAVQKFGIDSSSAVDKLKGYLKLLIDKSGMNPDPNENVEHFSKRAISAIISKKQ